MDRPRHHWQSTLYLVLLKYCLWFEFAITMLCVQCWDYKIWPSKMYMKSDWNLWKVQHQFISRVSINFFETWFEGTMVIWNFYSISNKVLGFKSAEFLLNSSNWSCPTVNFGFKDLETKRKWNQSVFLMKYTSWAFIIWSMHQFDDW